MKHLYSGNLLMVSNYASDTAYAWWLMEHFWILQANSFATDNNQSFIAYPQITTISDGIAKSPANPVELTIPWKMKQGRRKVKEFIKNNKIRCIYFTDQPYFSFKYLLLRLYGVKKIILHDHTPGDRPPIKGIKGALKALRNKIGILTADYVLCVSDLMRERNIKNGRIPPEKCKVVQNGIQPVQCKDNKIEVKKSLGIDVNSTVVITTGRAHPYKRFDFIIECANRLFGSHPHANLVFLLVGDGPAFSDLNKLIDKYNLSNKVRLLGFRNDIRELLCASDVAFHAALGEGFSLSIIEYMSAGLPVLVPDIPSVSQAVIHMKTGIIYPKNDAAYVIESIMKIHNDYDTRTAMSLAAKENADMNYNLEKCTSDFMNILPLLYALPAN